MPKKTKQTEAQTKKPAVQQKPDHSQPQAHTPAPDLLLQRAELDPSTLTTAERTRLQRDVGNRSLGRMAAPADQPVSSSSAAAAAASLQRMLERRSQAVPPIQAKLTLGPVDDPYEREADKVAKQVVGSLAAPNQQTAQRQGTVEEEEELMLKPLDSLQRQQGIESDDAEDELMMKASSTEAGGTVAADVESSIQSARGGGQPLSDGVRAPMENAFGADFSGVNVHTGGQADSLNQSLQARAFTTGQDIFFRSGEYQPDSTAGQELIAHELTHVVQQSSGSVQRSVVQRAVGFEFEDPTWTVFTLQQGRQFRKPTGFKSAFSSGRIAAPGSEKSDEEQAVEQYEGENVYQSGRGNHINGRVGSFNLQTGPKKGTLHEGNHYALEPDGPYSENGVTNRMDLEFVTEPFPETEAGFEQLVSALDDMQTIFNRISSGASGQWGGEPFQYDRFVRPGQHGFTDQSVFLYGGRPGGAFKPQVTSGMSLADVPDMMESLGVNAPGEQALSEEEQGQRTGIRQMVYGQSDPQNRTEAITLGDTPALAQTVVDKLVADGIIHDGVKGSDSLKGFLSLSIMYIAVLSAPDREGIKTRIPLLSRYSFATLFNQLPAPIRTGLKTAEGHVSLIAGLDAAIAGKVKSRGKDMDSPMIATGTIYREQDYAVVNDLMDALGSFSRKEWMLNVLNGTDLLTPDDLLAYLQRDEASDEQQQAATDYDKSIAIYLRGHGNTKNVKDVEGEESGGLALLENRGIAPWVGQDGPSIGISTGKEGMTFDQVHEMAIKYFAWALSIKQARSETERLAKIQEERLEDDASKARMTDFWG